MPGHAHVSFYQTEQHKAYASHQGARSCLFVCIFPTHLRQSLLGDLCTDSRKWNGRCCDMISFYFIVSWLRLHQAAEIFQAMGLSHRCLGMDAAEKLFKPGALSPLPASHSVSEGLFFRENDQGLRLLQQVAHPIEILPEPELTEAATVDVFPALGLLRMTVSLLQTASIARQLCTLKGTLRFFGSSSITVSRSVRTPSHSFTNTHETAS